MADEEKAKQSLSGVRFGTKHSYDDFGLVLQKKDLSLPEPKTEKIEVTGRNGGTVMLGWIVASLVICGWMASAYKTGKTIIELKNQIISLSYYAGVPHYQIQELKEKYGIK